MNLISKKDLLAITGISYGQLYRWKRERLIPEEWFIKQSAYTGQETFFPREQILSRIKSILELKDDYSLEELAKMLSPETSASKISLNNLTEIEEISNELIELLPELYNKEGYDFIEAVLMAVITDAATQLKLSAKQMGLLFSNSIVAVSDKNVGIICTVFTVGDDAHMLFTQNNARFMLDSGIAVKAQIHLSEVADNLKMKYKNLFTK